MNKPQTQTNFYAVIPAGGVGSRLWPLSRAKSPKFLLDFTGSGRSLLRETFERVSKVADPQRILVVTGRDHADAVQGQLAMLESKNLLREPSPKDSTAAIALAAAVVLRRDPNAIIGSFAADHVIRNPELFETAVTEAVRLAESGKIVTIGIKPTSASSAYGYIRAGASIAKVSDEVESFEAAEFVEKPAPALAANYFESGEYLWNAGMFVAKAQVLLDVLEQSQPQLHADLLLLAEQLNKSAATGSARTEFTETMDATWSGLKAIAIDYAIAEPAAATGLVTVVSAELDWTDIGDFDTLAELSDPRDALTHSGSGTVVNQDSSGLVVSKTDRVIAVSGLENVVIVDTPDALLVTTREQAQKVKAVVADLTKRGLDEVL